MLKHVSGDILLSKAHALVHSVAANDPMSQGLALTLHKKHPAMHKAFHHWCNQNHPKPGSAWLWGGSNGTRIVNLLCQNGGYGHGAKPEKATLKNVRCSLKELAKVAKKEAFTSLALPRIATGVGGLDWSEVLPIVEEKLGDLGIPVYIYSEFHAGQQATEA